MLATIAESYPHTGFDFDPISPLDMGPEGRSLVSAFPNGGGRPRLFMGMDKSESASS